jgi:signal transduction histidine kinase
MDLQYSPQGRVECILAISRVILVTFSLLAIWLDPSEPAKYAQITYRLLAGYVIYAVFLALLAWHPDALLVRLRLLTHVVDLLLFSVLMYFTEAPSSPFFVYFVFSLVSATLRWQWRGVLWTAAVALAMSIGMSMYAANILHDPAFKLHQFIIRSVYLMVIAALLVYVGSYEQRLSNELAELAAWPHTVTEELHLLVREILEYAANILDAPRALIVWQKPGQSRFSLMLWPHDASQWNCESSIKCEPLVAALPATANFLCPDAQASMPTVLYSSSAGFQRWQGVPLHPELRERFAIGAVLSLGLPGDTVEGRLFLLDKLGMTSDDLVLGAIVAREVVARLEQFYLLQQLQEAAAAEERIRLARDLHDGVLQSLAGAALQLEAVRQLLTQDPPTAQQRLLDLQRQLTVEQRDLRLLIQQLKPTRLNSSETDFELVARLHELGVQIERQWGVSVVVRIGPPVGEISLALARHLYFVVHEAVINAARHAHATGVNVTVVVEDTQVCITVADNGRGFPFHGQYDLATLTALNRGPVMLKERIASLDGSLVLVSTDAGSRLSITLPLTRPGA